MTPLDIAFFVAVAWSLRHIRWTRRAPRPFIPSPRTGEDDASA